MNHSFEMDLKGDHFHVQQQVVAADFGTQDVVVTLEDPRHHVITLGTRIPSATPTP